MRWLTTTALAVLAAVSVAACSNSSSSSDNSTAASSDMTNSAASAAPAESTEPAASTAAAGDNTTAGGVPAYPGATTEAAGSSSMEMGSGMASGKVLTTTDSFDKVYAWYQKNMPAGSEKAHVTSPSESAIFTVGEAGKDQQSVTITVANGKTMITIAHVKQQ